MNQQNRDIDMWGICNGKLHSYADISKYIELKELTTHPKINCNAHKGQLEYSEISWFWLADKYVYLVIENRSDRPTWIVCFGIFSPF